MEICLLHEGRDPGLLALRCANGCLQPAQRSVQYTLQLLPLACTHMVDIRFGEGSSVEAPEVCLSHHSLYMISVRPRNLAATVLDVADSAGLRRSCMIPLPGEHQASFDTDVHCQEASRAHMQLTPDPAPGSPGLADHCSSS
jgi:hypothetical protein